MAIRAPSEIRQLNDGISFPIVGTLEVRVDDTYGLFGPTSGIRAYKNLDEILARLSVSGTGSGGGGGSGVTLRTNGIPVGKFGTINFSGSDVKVTGSGDVSDVVIDPSVLVQEDGIELGRAKALNFSGAGFVVQLVDGIATVISQSSGTGGGGIAGVELQDEGVGIGTYSKLNFSGAGVTARQDGDRVTVLVQQGVTQERADKFAWFIRGGI